MALGGKAPDEEVGSTLLQRSSMETIARTPLQIGNNIREKRRELGLSQVQLAERIGLRQRTISDVENAGASRLDTVLRVLAALDLELVIRARSKSSAHDIEAIF